MDCYAILGIPIDADQAAIRAAYRVLARRYHPDTGTGSATEQFHQIARAYHTLSNPWRRERYDRDHSVALRTAQVIPRPAALYQESPAVFGRVRYGTSPRPPYRMEALFELRIALTMERE